MTTTPQVPQNTEHHAHDDIPREDLARALAHRTPVWKPILTAVVLFAAIGAIVGVGGLPKIERHGDLKETSERLQSLGKRVQVAGARLAPPSRTLTLPASLDPNAQADLFAQAVGYVRERRVDIGDRVKAGDVLAVIDIPLVEEDLNRTRASLAEAQAALAEVEKTRSLAQTTLERWKNVQPAGAVSKQEIDERTSAYEAAQASYKAAEAVVASREADVQRLSRQKAFAEVIAPFDGTITARNIDVGDYIGTTGPSSTPMFSIADTLTLRVYVDVPQTYAQSIEVGQTAAITLREFPGQSLEGTVTRTSGALNTRTRTLRVEVTLPNETGRVLAGAYGQVQFDVKQSTTPTIVPGSALLIRAEGPRVAIVSDKNTLHYIPVTTGRDLGTEVEITQGLTGNERIVVNMADELPEGTEVEIIQPVTLPSAAK